MTRRIAITMLALFLAAPLAATTGAEQAPVLRSGRYTLKYFGFSVGEEIFTIYDTPTGYEIHARLEMNAGDQPSSEGVYILDENRDFVRGFYRTLGDDPHEATYTVEDGTLTVRAVDDGKETVQSFSLGEHDIVTGPHYVTDFFVLAPVELDVGREKSVTAHAFGFKSWKVSAVDLDIERERSRRVRAPGSDLIEARVFRCAIGTQSETFKTRSFLDADGISNRITIERGIGYVDVRLKAHDRPVRIDHPLHETE